jgi:hypothetical protein
VLDWNESFPEQLERIADVSLIEGTIGHCNYRFFFTSPRNRTQEADGSIPFISTISFRFYFRLSSQGTIGERFRRQHLVEARDFASVRERLLNSGLF